MQQIDSTSELKIYKLVIPPRIYLFGFSSRQKRRYFSRFLASTKQTWNAGHARRGIARLKNARKSEKLGCHSA